MIRYNVISVLPGRSRFDRGKANKIVMITVNVVPKITRRTELLAELRKDKLVSIIGYVISKGFLHSATDQKDQPYRYNPLCPTYLLSLSPLEERAASLQEYIKAISRHGHHVDVEHLTTDPFWNRKWRFDCPEAAAMTLEWLAMTHSEA